MATQIAANVYKINNNNIPLASLSKISFPTAGILIRQLNPTQTINGAVCNSTIQYNKDLFYVVELQSALTTAAG